MANPKSSCQDLSTTKQNANSSGSKKKPLETAYFKMEEVIEGKRIPIYSWSWKNQRIKCWYFYVYKATPTPSGIQVKVVHRTPKRTLYYWTIEYSGIEGDAKNAGIPYGVRVTRKPFKKKLPKYVQTIIWRLLRLKRHEIKTPNLGGSHEQKEDYRIVENLFRKLGVIDPRGMRPVAPIRKRPRKIGKRSKEGDDGSSS